MKQLVLFITFPLFFFLTPSTSVEFNNQSNRCTEWDSTNTYKHLYIQICEYKSGGSGYYQFKNNYNKAVRFSFKIYHQNGNVTSGSTNVKSGKIHKASCYDCATKNGGGNKSYEIDNVYFEGEEGYW